MTTFYYNQASLLRSAKPTMIAHCTKLPLVPV